MRPRDRVTRGRPSSEPEILSVDLPSGPTIYGRPGGPPPEIPGNQFKTLAPMPYDEREETDPGRGAAPRRGGKARPCCRGFSSARSRSGRPEYLWLLVVPALLLLVWAWRFAVTAS